jgi:hypothetical protein
VYMNQKDGGYRWRCSREVYSCRCFGKGKRIEMIPFNVQILLDLCRLCDVGIMRAHVAIRSCLN